MRGNDGRFCKSPRENFVRWGRARADGATLMQSCAVTSCLPSFQRRPGTIPRSARFPLKAVTHLHVDPAVGKCRFPGRGRQLRHPKRRTFERNCLPVHGFRAPNFSHCFGFQFRAFSLVQARIEHVEERTFGRLTSTTLKPFNLQYKTLRFFTTILFIHLP